RLLLGQEHVLHGVSASQGRNGQHHRIKRRGERHALGKRLAFQFFEFFVFGQFDFGHSFSSPTPLRRGKRGKWGLAPFHASGKGACPRFLLSVPFSPLFS